MEGKEPQREGKIQNGNNQLECSVNLSGNKSIYLMPGFPDCYLVSSKLKGIVSIFMHKKFSLFFRKNKN